MSGNPFKVRNTYLGADGHQYNIGKIENLECSKRESPHRKDSREIIDSQDERYMQKYQDTSSVSIIHTNLCSINIMK
jgi:hypothetical protein